MHKLILTDVDDTVLNFSDHFQEWLEKAHGIYSQKRLRDHWNVPYTFDVTIQKSNILIDEFSTSDMMHQLRPEFCAVEVLPKLYRSGYRFVAITACTDDPKTKEYRATNLLNAFGFEWEDIHCVGLHTDKGAFLTRYDPSIWVEDKFENAVRGAEIGHEAFILDRNHNRHFQHDDVTRIKDWHDILEKIS